MAARLLFIGLWNFAEDSGVMEDRPRQIKRLILPDDKVDVEKLLNEISKAGLIFRYKIEGKALLIIKGFKKHQKIDRPRKYHTLPTPTENQLKSTEIRGFQENSSMDKEEEKEEDKEEEYIVGLTPDATFDLDIVSKVCERIEKHVKNICNGKTPVLDVGILAGKPTAPAKMLLSRIAEVRKGVPKYPDLTPEDVETYFLDLVDNLAESTWWVQQTTGGKSNLNLATIFGPKKWANKYGLVLLESGWIPPSRRKPEEIKLGF